MQGGSAHVLLCKPDLDGAVKDKKNKKFPKQLQVHLFIEECDQDLQELVCGDGKVEAMDDADPDDDDDEEVDNSGHGVSDAD